MLLWGMALVSFEFLMTILLILLVMFPALAVSIGFWFSIAGVFYIFLILHYFKERTAYMLSMVYIPVGVFVLMLPVVHGVFAVTNVYQLLSPLLSVLFVPFYPLVILLHLFGLGDIFDSSLLWLFSLAGESKDVVLPWWAMIGYIVLSIGAIWKRSVFYILFFLAFLYGFMLFRA